MQIQIQTHSFIKSNKRNTTKSVIDICCLLHLGCEKRKRVGQRSSQIETVTTFLPKNHFTKLSISRHNNKRLFNRNCYCYYCRCCYNLEDKIAAVDS